VTELDPQISMKIRDAAAACQRLKAIMDNTKDPERLKELQRQYDQAEQNMVQVSLIINRGISRPPPG
jgi:hypothetical protein